LGTDPFKSSSSTFADYWLYVTRNQINKKSSLFAWEQQNHSIPSSGRKLRNKKHCHTVGVVDASRSASAAKIRELMIIGKAVEINECKFQIRIKPYVLKNVI
jgi:hypothetical protein